MSGTVGRWKPGNPRRRVFANFRLLFGGRAMGALLNVGAIATLARALELGEFGTVVLVHAYVLTVRGFVNVKSSLSIVRWGVPLQEADDNKPLLALLNLTRRIDRLMAPASAVLAAALAPLAGRLLGWDSDTVVYCAVFSAALLFSGVETPRGYLQLTNRFDLLAQQMAVGPAIRLLGALAASWIAPRMDVFLAVWGGSMAVEYLFLSWRGKQSYAAASLRISRFGGVSFTQFPGMPRFLTATYFQSILEMVPNRLTTLMVGASLGAESAGLYKAARDCATVVARPAVLLSQAAFPDIARLWQDDYRKFRRLIVRVCVIAGCAGLALTTLALLFGGWLLDALFGPEFPAAQVLLTWLVFAAALELSGAALTPAGYAMDRAGQILASRTLGTLTFVLGFFLLQTSYGLNGVGMAVASGSACLLLALLFVVGRRPPGNSSESQSPT